MPVAVRGLTSGATALAATAPAAARLLSFVDRLGEADRRYRDGFLRVGASGCPLLHESFASARRSDAAAGGAKRRFVPVYNPPARRAGRTWAADEM